MLGLARLLDQGRVEPLGRARGQVLERSTATYLSEMSVCDSAQSRDLSRGVSG